MDINARINWHPGMELTSLSFKGWDERLDFRQRLALRTALGNNRLGLLPDAPFECKGMFVKNKLEINRLRCLAVLPSGRIVDADEPVAISIPMLYGSEYYLTIGFSDGQVEFEQDTVPYLRPQYEYAIRSIDEMQQSDVFPLMRFSVNEGVFSIDEAFIQPCLMLSSDERYQTYLNAFFEQIAAMAAHANLEEGDGKRMLLRYMFLLKGFNLQQSVQELISLMEEIAQAIDYFIVTPHAETPVQIPNPDPCDHQKWLEWMKGYLGAASSILDGVVLEDNTIDYEALLAQAKQELYERLNPELYEKLLLSIKDELREELSTRITETLTDYIRNTFRPELEQEMGKQLYDYLFEQLYLKLFDNLFNALYVPEPEEKQFIPQI